MNELDELAKKYGTDKQLACHGYTKYYEEYFKPLRNNPIKMLEIGVHMGFSLLMWADYFQDGNIWGIDDGSSGDLRRNYENPRIHFREGSQINEIFLKNITNEVGKFDIICDDGSHYSQDIVTTFNILFPFLKSGGYYVIEDQQCSYPPYTTDFGSRFNANNLTSVQYINLIVDRLHKKEDKVIDGIFIHPEITFIRKK